MCSNLLCRPSILCGKKGLLRKQTNSLDYIYLSRQTLMITPTKGLQ